VTALSNSSSYHYNAYDKTLKAGTPLLDVAVFPEAGSNIKVKLPTAHLEYEEAWKVYEERMMKPSLTKFARSALLAGSARSLATTNFNATERRRN